MEILSSVCIATIAPFHLSFGISTVVFLIAIIFFIAIDEEKLYCAAFVFFAICFAGALLLPKQINTDQYRYTIEITDQAKFREFVDKGYTFIDRPYENKDIYVIEGKQFEEDNQE